MCMGTAMLPTKKDGTRNKQSISSKTVRPFFLHFLQMIYHKPSALSLAMSRDGSSGGVIRMCVITEDGVERKFVPGDQLPKFWEGQEVLGKPASLKTEGALAPMAVEPL
jgi:hypothetical protein